MKPFLILAGAVCLAIPQPSSANVVHIIAFRYKPEASPAARAETAKRIIGLKKVAKRNGRSYIVSIRGGDAVSAEGFDQKLDHLFMLEFRTASDRNFFVGPPYRRQMDPEHRKVADLVESRLDRDPAGKPKGPFVFDFAD